MGVVEVKEKDVPQAVDPYIPRATLSAHQYYAVVQNMRQYRELSGPIAKSCCALISSFSSLA
jgi:hypothetical protein